MTNALTTNHPITAKILEQVTSINFQLPESVEDKWTEIEQKEIALAVHIAELGYRYMDLRDAVGHGEFMNSLKERGISQRSVNRYMNIAKFFLDSPESNWTALSNLNPTKIGILTRLPEEEKQALTPEKIGEYAPMSTRALEAEVKQLRLQFDEQTSIAADNHRLTRRVKQLEEENAQNINLLNQEQLSKAPETIYGLHPEVANTRKKCIAIGELLSTLTIDLNHLIERCTNSNLASELSNECAVAINTSTSGQIMQLANSLTTLHNSFDKNVLNAPDNLPVYDPLEVTQALNNVQYSKADYLSSIGAL